ncbi:MAG TPA: glutathione S-transferase family protein [Stellaceae bacterium]|nr:glutathione S-transferase family protein [Terriglobia bacterium]HEV2548993.1 glutathione S-transferase family protein [Stellaceae bacterium]
MKIYWIKAQAPRRVLALAKHLNLVAEFIHLDLMSGDLKAPSYAELNPNLKAPTLVDGAVVLWESSAIMAYLCLKQGSDMWPIENHSEQVEVLRWLSWNDNHWAPAVGPFYFEHIVKSTFGIGPPDRQSLLAKKPQLLKLAAILNRELEGRKYIVGNRLTIADFQLASMATDWSTAEMPLTEFPNIVGWLAGLNRIPAWADPWPGISAAA